MVWEPFLLAIGFGIAVSAAIYFAILWPQVEPLDDDEVAALGGEPEPDADAKAAPAPAPAPAPGTTKTGETEDDAVS
jgi:hypothetical protein